MKLLNSLLLATGLLATGPALAHSYVSTEIVLEAPQVYVGYREVPRYRDDYYVRDHERYARHYRHYRHDRHHRHDRHCRHGDGRRHRHHHGWHH